MNIHEIIKSALPGGPLDRQTAGAIYHSPTRGEVAAQKDIAHHPAGYRIYHSGSDGTKVVVRGPVHDWTGRGSHAEGLAALLRQQRASRAELGHEPLTWFVPLDPAGDRDYSGSRALFDTDDPAVVMAGSQWNRYLNALLLVPVEGWEAVSPTAE